MLLKIYHGPFQQGSKQLFYCVWGQMEIPRDQRWRIGGCLAAGLVYRKLLYEGASKPALELILYRQMRREKEDSCCQLFPVTVDFTRRTWHALYFYETKNHVVLCNIQPSSAAAFL